VLECDDDAAGSAVSAGCSAAGGGGASTSALVGIGLAIAALRRRPRRGAAR
jgi:MYXO-CTERM domain-containing protein